MKNLSLFQKIENFILNFVNFVKMSFVTKRFFSRVIVDNLMYFMQQSLSFIR